MKETFDSKPAGGKNYDSDLACERRRIDPSIDGVEYRRFFSDGFIWERVRISSDEGASAIGRPKGSYDTLTLGKAHLLDEGEEEDAASEIAKALAIMLERCGADCKRILVVGLGNADLTPDSIGPKSASGVNATMHIKSHDRAAFDALECSEIAVIIPGVMGQSGMEASDIILGVCKKISPDAVIAIDSLASRSPKRLGTTVQISNTGIFPGSGIGNRRSPITEEELGVPVIAIGVPTVINARLLCSGDGEELWERDEREDLYVSPREIDEITNACSRIIARGINQAFGIL